MNQSLFKISEIAKLTGVSRQALIYYDKENIIKPVHVDDHNNYRYYTVDQIHHIQIINMLKEYGMSLNEIKAFIDKKNTAELLMLIDKMKAYMLERLEQTNNFLQILNEKEVRTKKSLGMIDEIKLEDRQPFTVLCSEKLSEDEQGEGHYTVAFNFETLLKKNNIMGLGLDTIVEKEYLTQDYDNEISYFCMKVESQKTTIAQKEIKGGTYAVAYHVGEYKTSATTYQKLLAYINELNYKIAGDAYECIIKDFFTSEDERDYILEIAIPVENALKSS